LINALSIDLEYWYSAELVREHAPTQKEDQIVEATMPIVNLLDRYKTEATFFVLGKVAEQHPELVKMIFEKGHEIASHAYSHKMLHELGKDKFEEEISKSVEVLSAITGQRPIGFRAPSCSLDNSTSWALETIAKYGFKYDSSIFPVKTMLYGVSKAPLHPYKPSFQDIISEDPGSKLIEFPITVVKLGMKIPMAGGFYLRALPLWFLKFAIRRVNKVRPAVIYVHPWETYVNTPRLRLPLSSRFITYYGIGSSLGKLEALIKNFEFKPVKQVLGLS